MKRDFKKIKNFFRALPLAAARHAFLSCLFLFFLSLLILGFLFYKYGGPEKEQAGENPDQSFQIREKIRQEVLGYWRQEEKRFEEAGEKTYSDPFSRSIPFPGQ